MANIRELLTNKTSHDRSVIKVRELLKTDLGGHYSSAKYNIEIDTFGAVEHSEGCLEILARAFRGGKPIGFGKDGSVEYERFLIHNPSILVEDPTGDIVKEFGDALTGEKNTLRLKEDHRGAVMVHLSRVIDSMLEGGVVAHLDSRKIRPGKTGNTTSTFRPDEDAETNTMDGVTGVRDTGNDWDTAHDATSGGGWVLNTDGTTMNVVTTQNQGGDSMDVLIGRSVATFDTSSISGTDTIDSASLAVVVNSASNNDNDGNDFVAVVQTQGQNLVSDTDLADADFDQVGDAINNPTEAHDSGQRKDISSMSGGGGLTFTFNSTGLGWIARSGEAKPTGATNGITYLGFRTGHDILDDPHGVGNAGDSVALRTADYTGGDSANDPILSVTHSAPSSPSSSVSSSISSSVSPSTSISSSISSSASSSVSSSISSSISSSPSPGYADYTRGDYAALPGDDTDLSTAYSSTDYDDVETDNSVRVAQDATPSDYAIHQFKDYVGTATGVTVTWNGQTNEDCSFATVTLQIYNHDTTTWDTIDSDNSTAADTDFDLSATVADLTDYKDGSSVISCRVYQQAT